MAAESNHWISVARVARFVGDGRYHLTVGGDGLAGLPLPAKLTVFPAGTTLESEGASVETIPGGDMSVVTLTELVIKGHYGRAHIESDRELEKGAVLAVSSTELLGSAADGEIFWFELQGLPVYTTADGLVVGNVTGLSETGAHGILEVTTATGIVLVPLLDQFVAIHRSEGRVLIPDLDDFRP